MEQEAEEEEDEEEIDQEAEPEPEQEPEPEPEPDQEQQPEQEPDPDPEEDFQDNYNDILQSLSKKWLETQLTHKVSARATNLFWDCAMDFIPKLMDFQQREGRTHGVPKFIQQRRKLYSEYCPQVTMHFGFRKKSDGSIIKVLSETAPVKELQGNNEYIKLYEIASIKVRKDINI